MVDLNLNILINSIEYKWINFLNKKHRLPDWMKNKTQFLPYNSAVPPGYVFEENRNTNSKRYAFQCSYQHYLQ